MLYCRFATGADIQGWGIVEHHEVWEVTPDIFSDFQKTGRSFPMNDVRFLAPCIPSKVIGIGLNYKAHVEEFGRTQLPAEPVVFLKAPSAVIGLGDQILLPKGAGKVDYEGELGIVIKKLCRSVSEAEAKDYILGCTCVNDVTARDLQKKDSQWARAKSFDSFCPIGPWIADELPFGNLRVETYLNSKPVQQGHTKNMIFNVEKLVSYVSGIMTLYPGDVISTGTPEGVGPMSHGDIVEVFVEGVGRIRNTVVQA